MKSERFKPFSLIELMRRQVRQINAVGCFWVAACLFATTPVIAAPQQRDIVHELNLLKPYQSHITKRLTQFKPLINRIFDQLDGQSLPASLVLVPMLESSFDVNAVSHANAAGLWQLIPATAQRFGLQVDKDKDQRFDSNASTQAALKYLHFLYNKFDQDLALTLAAYNAGEGRVARAIKRANSRQFSRLTLPHETRQYVHRFYALKVLIDVEKLKGKSFQPLFLFANGVNDNRLPLVDLAPLPPLITL
ncbi:lytic transglycosylase domain-containing protein [Vibrio japonicus]|uniref:Lytic transglycosylase domain-containing protein n=1 Tax=Vibrio japonicus TaxID=1824638 RepID=A0ABY5LJQ0_9VIBR|nr:lytic transglycosylase domain-containing protein [Vibrio japonicus]UUM32282.1 lytic transglycosylase domain-containing protein [Vibrio japonicus]